jgi:putative DNA primase/helicase
MMNLLTPSEFFSRVWPTRLIRDEKLELRAIDRKADEIHREFSSSVSEFLESAGQYTKLDVYFGVSTRFREGGTKRDCFRVNAIWADFDEIPMKKVINLSLPPNIVVGSGGGTHGYWLLTCPKLVRDIEDIRYIEAIARGLAERFGADTKTIDITRILRVPGFRNRKPEYESPPLIKSYLVHENLYQLETFRKSGFFKEKTDDPGNYVGTGKVRTDLPPKIIDALRHISDRNDGDDPSQDDSAVITRLLNFGLSQQDTYSTFMSSHRGKDVLERKSGHAEDYVQRTVRKAAEFIKKNPKGRGVVVMLPKPDKKIRRDDTGGFWVDFSGEVDDTVDDGKQGLVAVRASKVTVQNVHWTWRGWFPDGKLTVIAGDPGLGKSTFTLDMISRISRGGKLPLEKNRVGTGNCLIISFEDAAGDTIVPRLIMADANLDRIDIFKHVNNGDDKMSFSLFRDFNSLEQYILKRCIHFVMIDPLGAFLGGLNSNTDSDVRSVLGPIEKIAERTRATIAGVTHYNKKEESSEIYRVLGSIAIVGAARSVINVKRTEESKERMIISNSKVTNSKIPLSLEYEIHSAEKHKTNGEWKGEDYVQSSRIKWYKSSPKSDNASQKDTAKATEFLVKTLSDGPMKEELLFEQARQGGIEIHLLKKIYADMGLKPRRNSKGGFEWRWSGAPSSL